MTQNEYLRHSVVLCWHYRTIEAPSSRIVIIEGIYALSERLRPLLDLRVSVRGGVHFDLVKRVLRDIQRAGQEPEEIIHQISETVCTLLLLSILLHHLQSYLSKLHSLQVYPMYKAFIEPDLETAHIKIINKFNPFTGFQSPTYILKVIIHLALNVLSNATFSTLTQPLFTLSL